MARILISMKDNFLKTVDEIAEREQRTRSELIREALRNYFNKMQSKTPERANKNAAILDELLD